jgi:prepilin peptidase CpaA
MIMLEYPLLLVFPIAMAFAAAFDLFTMTIPNKISLALLAAFAVAAPLSGMSLSVIGIHLAVGAAVLAVGFGCFVRGWVGGGDAKLLAASALWLGFDPLLQFMLTVGVLGGVLSVTILLYRRIPDASTFGQAWLARLHSKDSGVPYGLAIAGAALIVYPQTQWFTTLFAA